ncbi:glycine zipper family protein [Neokomagataea anthophila]|uniref:glycine zipper family protein n=1 Tax=Neokomagataea anthophila TaxID=2826925 RepID=UPI002010EBEB|nr:glycine zipper family protein [Neokomagataea anthophila]
MFNRTCVVAATLCLALAGCAETPMGPTVQVYPAPGKNYQTFLQEQQFCKTQAENAVAGQASHENQRALLGAVATTALGTGLGAALGGGTGAGIGAASGALGSGLGGGLYSRDQQGGIQSQYNNAFAQCMLTYRNVIPGYNNPATERSVTVITRERETHRSSVTRHGVSNTTTEKTAVTTAPMNLD